MSLTEEKMKMSKKPTFTIIYIIWAIFNPVILLLKFTYLFETVSFSESRLTSNLLCSHIATRSSISAEFAGYDATPG